MIAGGAPAGLFEDAAFRAGVARLGARGLTYDTWHYHYQNPGQHGVFDVYTLGRDNQAGGEGVDADVGNWD